MENRYEGDRFKPDENDAYSVFTSFADNGTTADPERRLPTYCLLDEEDGGYIAFTTDDGLAERLARELNVLHELRAILNETDRPSHNRVAQCQLALDRAGLPTPIPTEAV